MAAIPSLHLPLSTPTRRPRRALLVVGASVAAAAAGLAAARLGAPRGIDADLLVLLRAMAALKAVLVVVALAVVAWRFRLPTSPGIALAYGGSIAVMSFATALIWMSAFIGLAALAFHAALFAALVAAWRDERVVPSRRTR